MVSVPPTAEWRATLARAFAGRKAWRLAAIPVAVWLLTGIYAVGSDEEGIVLRFGRVAGRSAPGLHYALPRPVNRIERPRTTEVRRVEVGFRILGKLLGSDDARASDMLTGDENILKLMMVVQYKLKDPVDYLFNTEDADGLVDRAVESSMSAAVAWRSVDDVLTGAKAEIQIEAIQRAQERLDRYGAGITLLGGNLQVVSPPAPVIAAFNDVSAARKDAESAVENARLYANQIVPRARADADKMVNEARGRAETRVNLARGESDRFTALLAEYVRDRDLTRRRLYLESMERILGRARLVVTPDASRITILDDATPR